MQLLGYEFEKPYIFLQTTFYDIAAVYIVYTILNGKTIWLDVGETDKLGNRLSTHERKDCWLINSLGREIYIGVMQVKNEFTRRNIELDLRNKLLPICGE